MKRLWLTPPEHEEFFKKGTAMLKITDVESVSIKRIADPSVSARNALVTESSCQEFLKDEEVRLEVMGAKDLTARAVKEEQEARRALKYAPRNPAPVVAAA